MTAQVERLLDRMATFSRQMEICFGGALFYQYHPQGCYHYFGNGCTSIYFCCDSVQGQVHHDPLNSQGQTDAWPTFYTVGMNRL